MGTILHAIVLPMLTTYSLYHKFYYSYSHVYIYHLMVTTMVYFFSYVSYISYIPGLYIYIYYTYKPKSYTRYPIGIQDGAPKIAFS